ncbi:MAG: hypothetical protein IJ466_03245 [Clostridia bacterium]|nr:hypothetical protein [Clostridia bacterium]
MRRKKRVTGRFYIFLLVLLAIAFLIARPHLNLGSKEAVIIAAQSEFSQMMDCAIIRDEQVITSDSTARVEYIAPEGTLVNAGDTVAYVYTAGYSEGLLAKLEETRAEIQDYHKNQILNNIKDADLERYDTIVDMMVLEFKNLVNHRSSGSLLTAAQQLETAMVNRQEYLRQNKREDTKLSKLYDTENTRLSSIQSWRKVESAAETGVVSFYTDGYEGSLSVETLPTLTAADIRTVLTGGNLGAAKSAKTADIYRLVNQDSWYVALVTSDDSWNPVVGQQYYLQMEGFEDLSFTAYVTSVQKDLAIFQINDPIGPLIYQRTGKAKLSSTISGLSVVSRALYEQNGQMGVWLYDVPGGTFVPVEVLSNDGSHALIQPLVENAIGIGQTVLIK